MHESRFHTDIKFKKKSKRVHEKKTYSDHKIQRLINRLSIII